MRPRVFSWEATQFIPTQLSRRSSRASIARMSALSYCFCYIVFLIAVGAFNNAGARMYVQPVNQDFQKIVDSIQDLVQAVSKCQSAESVLKVAEVLRSQQTTLSEIMSSTALKPPLQSQSMSYDLVFQLGEYKQKFDEISPRFEEAEEKLKIFEERLMLVETISSQSREECNNTEDRIEELVQKVEATIEADNETMTQIEERLLELETNSSQARGESQINEDVIQDLVQQVEAISKGADKRTKEVEEHLLQMETTASQAKEELQNNEDKIQDLVQKVEAISKGADEGIKEVENRLLQMETTSSQAKEELQNNKGKIQDLMQKMEAISKGIDERAKEMEERLLQMEMNSSQAKEELQNNEDKIQDLIQKVEVISKRFCQPPFYHVGQDCLYINSKDKHTWSGCRTFCKTFGGDLVVPSDVLKLRDYLIAANKGLNYWIGASDSKEEGAWTWLNGHTMDLSVGWSTGEPNNAHGKENCAQYADGFDLKLNDNSCSQELYCICQNTGYPT